MQHRPELEAQAVNWDRFADQDVSVYGTSDPRPPADFLAHLIHTRLPEVVRPRALELGAGVGSVAQALAAHGFDVTALDISPKMVEAITAANDPARPVTAVVGDMADPPAPGPFDLVYVITSTIYSILTQQRQIDCFASIAKLLTGRGAFVVDAYVPLRSAQVTQSSRSTMALRGLGEGHADISATAHDPASQRLSYREIRIGNGNTTVLPIECRYIWPSEMNLMAQLAGLSLQDRYAGWDQRPFDSGSARHVSIFTRS